MTSKEAKKKDVEEVVLAFSTAGFVNVSKVSLMDLKIGILSKEGQVESITIAGNSDFKKKNRVRLDSAIQINYHTFSPKR